MGQSSEQQEYHRRERGDGRGQKLVGVVNSRESAK
jgi:hypothetical protein